MDYAQQLREEQFKFTKHIGFLINFANDSANGFALTFGEAWRSEETQAAHVKAGRSKTMNSQHLKRLAVDFNIFYKGKLLFIGTNKDEFKEHLQIAKPLGEYWMSLDSKNVWGADWNRNFNLMDETFADPYHFERNF